MSRHYSDKAATDDTQWIQANASNTAALQAKILALKEVIGHAEDDICGCCCCADDEDCYQDIHAAQKNITLCKSLLAQQ